MRLVWAALFAVATLLQLPSMAIAATSASLHHHDMSAQQDLSAQQDSSAQQDLASAPQHAHHQHHNGHHDSAVPDGAHEGPACFALGCCFALGVASFSAPTASHILLGTLAHEPARVMLPSRPDPAVPPPRFQV